MDVIVKLAVLTLMVLLALAAWATFGWIGYTLAFYATENTSVSLAIGALAVLLAIFSTKIRLKWS